MAETAARGSRRSAGLAASRVAATVRDATIRAVTAIGARIDGIPTLAVDVALALVVLAMMVSEQLSEASALGSKLPPAVALATAIAGSLVLRRRAPLTAYLVGTVALSVEALWVMADSWAPYANLVALYSVGQYATRRRALWGPVIALPGILAYFANIDASATLPAGVLFMWLLAWAAGYSSARRRERQDAARQLMRREVIADERARMARELHDLIGHTVNVMLVQAGASRVVLDSDPDKAREMLIAVEQTGREALDELDRVLGVLRLDDGPDLQPGLAELPRLAQRMTEAGMAVAVWVDEPARQLPRSLDLSAYRIVQEALTNALRHGRARSATVSVHCDGQTVELGVHDDGRGPQPAYLPGRGLLGIAERVAAFGGTVKHGGGEGGGFYLRVALRLP